MVLPDCNANVPVGQETSVYPQIYKMFVHYQKTLALFISYSSCGVYFEVIGKISK